VIKALRIAKCITSGQREVVIKTGSQDELRELLEAMKHMLGAINIQIRQEEMIHSSRLSILGRIASELGHEINQPLGTILMQANVCQRQLHASPVDLSALGENLQEISRQAELAGSIVRRIRAFSAKKLQKKTILSVEKTSPNSSPCRLVTSSKKQPGCYGHHYQQRLKFNRIFIPAVQSWPTGLRYIRL